MRKFKRYGTGIVALICVSLLLVACGENTATPLPTPKVVPSNTATTASAATPAKIISENDSDSTLRLKVGDSFLAGFSPEMNWNFELDPAAAKGVLVRSVQPAPEPYQAKFEAQTPGTVNLKAQGSCRPKPGEMCNNAILVYSVTITVS